LLNRELEQQQGKNTGSHHRLLSSVEMLHGANASL
jgi:hypothetical protein